ncbi:MAG: CHAT domain-containing protein, partial [Caldilineaceae bacterium]|nr:CHAT domain-containing protein [Caldilineaceae bacterium]
MIRILFLAANPVDQARLRVRAEFNGVRQVLDVTAAHDRFQLIPEFDATPDELQDLLTRHRPQIIHFSGHGTTAGLLFADQDGEGRLVAPQSLRDLFGSFNETVRCVVLNACSSAQQAEAIAGVVDAVVGMGDVVSDDAALAFATAFYRALMSDATLATAMTRARNQIDL